MRAKLPLCRMHHKDALLHDEHATREGYYRAQFPLNCVFCQHDAAMMQALPLLNSRSTLEASERAWAKGEGQ